jgi:hypothetical protein|tara:strand:+ start:226 stop:405 length:180 start_codon:yes stop_codon:yes gene_type:complete
MEINVYYKNVYGTDLCYPACENAKILADIAGQKTLSTYTLSKVRRLGYNINVVAYDPTT